MDKIRCRCRCRYLRGLKVSLGNYCWWYRSSYGTDVDNSEIASLVEAVRA